MLEVGFRELKDAATDLRNKQSVRRPYFMTASIPVPNGGLARATLVGDSDADTYITGINGAIIAPADANGRRVLTGNTIWPVPFTGAQPQGYAETGLRMRWFENSDKELSLSDPNTFCSCRSILQPGYRMGWFSRPFPFERFLKRGAKLTFEFINSDTGTGPVPLFHFVSLTLTCKKYDGFVR